MTGYRDARGPAGPTPACGISGGAKGTAESGGGHSSSTPAGPPDFGRAA